MKINFKAAFENTLFGLLVFIAFLLVFDKILIIPRWVQPFGRMHPLILHFPIVILIASVLLDLFSDKMGIEYDDFFKNFSSSLLFTGAFLASITAIFGLILSKEAGYSGNLLHLHKWTGVGCAFLSSLIYWIRKRSWYKTPVKKINAVIIMILILFTGHFGAGLTHGDDFIMAPLNNGEIAQVPIEKAMIYENVIQPIFNQKCISCHNPDKIKGGLELSDEKAILRGGKSGKLFVVGNPEMSLLLQRVHLPAEDKKHMPPVGKSQLTDDEVALLKLWVKSNDQFKEKLIDLPEGDSLRVMASKQFTKEKTEETFDFAAADAKVIAKLNTNYRIISVVANNSPALEVNFFNRSQFHTKDLEDLNQIKDQIITLNLGKMPVKDQDLKKIADFKNLRELNLNYTDVNGSGLKDLIKLNDLKSLSLSGTKLNAASLTDFGKFKQLEKVFLWDTGLSDADLAKIKNTNKNLTLVTGFKDDGKHPIKLNLPELENASPVFQNNMLVHLVHPIKGTTIRYTLDGTLPDSIKSPIYLKEIVVKKDASVKARAFKSGWLGSDVVQIDLFKSDFKPDSIALLSVAVDNYRADGGKTLMDGQMGTLYFKGSGEKWLGCQADNMDLSIVFNEPVLLSSIGVNTMYNPKLNVFPPVTVEIWGGSSKQKLTKITTLRPKRFRKEDYAETFTMAGTFKPGKFKYLKIVAKPLIMMPKNKKALFLVDELFFN